VKYLAVLKIYGGTTDREAADLMGIERTSINARRVPLVKAGVVVADGFREGPMGVKNTIWRLA